MQESTRQVLRQLIRSLRVVNHQFLPGMVSGDVKVLSDYEVTKAADYLAQFIRSAALA
jgi:hypothetical protein